MMLNLPKFNAEAVRDMESGETRIFRNDCERNTGSSITHYSGKMSCRFLTSKLMILSPKTGESLFVLAVTMVDCPATTTTSFN